LIFWGPTWTTDSAEQAVMAAQQQLFHQLAGTSYDRLLGQYTDTIDFPHDDVRLEGTWIDTSPPSSFVDGWRPAGRRSTPRRLMVGKAASTPTLLFIRKTVRDTPTRIAGSIRISILG